MAHISLMGLFDYAGGRATLTAQETEHLQDCADCMQQVVELRRVIEASADLSKTRRFLAEQPEPLFDDRPKAA